MQVVKANARVDATRAFGAVCKTHPEAAVRQIRTIVVCTVCGWTLVRGLPE